MNSKKFFTDYFSTLKTALDEIDVKKLEKSCELLKTAYKGGKTIFTIGNGGSASTASHMACDLAKTVRGHKGDSKWKGFKAICLADNMGLITAWANDAGYEKVFSGQLENLGSKGDILIAISSSGNSENILSCVKLAKELGIKTIGISGFKGGKLKNLVDVALVSSEEAYGPVEDIQLVINHAITNYFINYFNETFSHTSSS